MIRKILEKRKEHEAAEKKGATGAEKETKKRKGDKEPAAKKTSRRAKSKVAERKRLMWAVFNGSMKEEGRFPYDQREAADEKVQQLKTKSPKKIYFVQVIKETLAPAQKTLAADGAEA